MISYIKRNWAAHLLDVKSSMVVEIMGRVLVCVAWAIVVVAMHHLSPLRMAISPTIHTLVGVVVGLLLVFRTNSSYDRYWEGRRQWGAIINESRNLARATRAYLAPSAPDLADQILAWAAAFPYATMNALRDRRQADFGPSGDRLPAGEVAAVLASPNVPLAVAVRVSEGLAEARDRGVLSDILLAAVDANVQQLIDYYGACERIKKTPLPFVYVAHLRRTLVIYCFTLPLAVVAFYGWWTILISLLTAYIFFGIEEIGVEIENPFGYDVTDLSLESFCQTIARELLNPPGSVPRPASS
jgi:putative membrane protein